MKVQIIGAGIAGISLGYHLDEIGIDFSLFEARKTWGGLLDSFEPYPGYIFDRFIHLSFTNNHYVKSLFDKSVNSVIHDNPKPYNLDNKIWLKHPVQFNLAPLSSKEKVQIINGFINADTRKEINNYAWEDDYPNQTYWITFNFNTFINNAKWPEWLNIAIGIGLDNTQYLNEDNMKIGGNNEWYIALDYDIPKLLKRWNSPIAKKLKNCLNYIHFPAPTIKISPKLAFYPLFL